MTEPETTQPVAENDAVPPGPDAEGAAPPEPEPEPEPWTPERVNEWNAYYDRYVLLATLLLALIVACNYVTDSRLFLHLKTGQLIAGQKSPVAIISPLGSANPQVKSSDSEKIVE